MEFQKILNANNHTFREVWKIYDESFPLDERRDSEQQSELLRDSNYSFFSIIQNRLPIGLLGVWQFSEFDFIEHFAISKSLRNNNLGSEAIKEYSKRITKTLILETERPDTNQMTERRIQFWQRNGFKLNSYDYIQPPYSSKKSPLPMYLMSNPTQLSEGEFESVRANIHKVVYNLKSPLLLA